MKELKRINSKIGNQQIGRIVTGLGSVILGLILIGKFMYQKGVTDCQGAISKEFPDEYAAITEKVIHELEDN